MTDSLSRAARTFYSVFFWIYLIVTCAILFSLGVVLFLLTAPFDSDRRVLHYWSCFWSQFYFYTVPGWHLRIDQRELIPKGQGVVLVSNHQSLGDILALSGLYRPFKWVSKASVFNVPFIGWFMRLNRYVSVVRGSRESVKEMMEECEALLSRGISLFIFPEGSRSPDGQVKPFKDGAFSIATKVSCPVVPVVVAGTSHTLPKNGLRLDFGANCLIRVLPPVDPQNFGGDVSALRDHVRSLIVAEHARAEAELLDDKSAS